MSRTKKLIELLGRIALYDAALRFSVVSLEQLKIYINTFQLRIWPALRLFLIIRSLYTVTAFQEERET